MPVASAEEVKTVHARPGPQGAQETQPLTLRNTRGPAQTKTADRSSDQSACAPTQSGLLPFRRNQHETKRKRSRHYPQAAQRPAVHAIRPAPAPMKSRESFTPPAGRQPCRHQARWGRSTGRSLCLNGLAFRTGSHCTTCASARALKTPGLRWCCAEQASPIGNRVSNWAGTAAPPSPVCGY